MMTRFQKIFLSASCLILVGAPKVWAVGVDVFGAGTYSMGTGTPTPTAALAYPGGGIGFNFKLGSKVDLNITVAYLSSKFTVNVLGTDVAVTNTKLNGQLGFVFNLAKALAFDVGGHYNYYLKSDGGYTLNDYGAQAGISLRIPMGATSAFFIHPQYHYALSKIKGDLGEVTPSEVVALVGFSFGMSTK